MAGLARITKALKAVNKKVKKHGVKAGQKSAVRPSQQKSVKNGRHQEKETPKVIRKKAKIADAQIPLHTHSMDDEMDDFLEEPTFDEFENDEPASYDLELPEED